MPKANPERSHKKRKKERWTYKMYRFQQRIAITQQEVRAIWVLCLFLFLGLMVRTYQKHQPAIPDDAYAETDSLFFQANKALKEAEARQDSVAASPPSDSSLLAFFTPAFPVNINTADQEALETLPRIGPRTAERIIAYRNQYGPFQKKSDLMRVKGIGEKTYARLADKISVR